MPKLTPIPRGPQLGNRIGSETLKQGAKTTTNQANINAAIKRIRRVRAQFDAIARESARIGKSIKSRAGIAKEKAASDAGRLRGTLDKGLSSAQQRVSTVIKTKDTINVAFSQPSTSGGKIPVESGKGRNLNVNA